MRRWLFKLATLCSQAFNALVLGGSPDESVSGRAHREGWRLEWWIDRLFFWEPHHCRRAHESDVAFAKMILGL
jgi:hypothetical protein